MTPPAVPWRCMTTTSTPAAASCRWSSSSTTSRWAVQGAVEGSVGCTETNMITRPGSAWLLRYCLHSKPVGSQVNLAEPSTASTTRATPWQAAWDYLGNDGTTITLHTNYNAPR